MQYNVHEIEKKWQKRWKEHPLGQTRPKGSGVKFYCLDMFPYPSGSGLHVGHWRGYVLSDVYTRIKWLQGYNILHPMGWDAFGLPAENDAIKKGIAPKEGTAKNIAHFKEQLQEIAALYDWSKEINTTDPKFYKWTQWIFIKMFKAGLAYESLMPINWCPSCLTGLANEEVVDGKCERCSTKVEHKNVRQWVLKITAYAEKLLEGLNRLEWPEKVKLMQRNWIGKSEGVQVTVPVINARGERIPLSFYTTCSFTTYGITFFVMAPDHDLVERIADPQRMDAIKQYQEQFSSMKGTERLEHMHEKTGIFTGAYAEHPFTGEKIPLYLANYVLKDYGTGIVMGVPAHDQRDFEFAQQYNIPIKQVIDAPEVEYGPDGTLMQAYEGDGVLINSDSFNGLQAFGEGKEAITQALIKKGIAERKVMYKLRDWLFSRQRYWGEPIPLIHCERCGVVPVPEKDLPVVLPEVEQYQPTGTGESPLAAIDWWVNVQCPQCGGPGKRETNTMPQWAGSSWYFLRYPNPELNDEPFDYEDMKYWLPVDLYVGGIEHAILHLLYARFYVKVLHDLGYLPFDEPFKELFNQGMITKYSEKSGLVEKMSKSKGNVVNPDEIVKQYGSDVLRMYILFMGPPELDAEWQDSGLEGIKRFLFRLWGYITKQGTMLPEGERQSQEATKRLHRFIRDFQERVDIFKPNTALSAFMEFLNEATEKNMAFENSSIETIIVILSCMAPHMASELLETLLSKSLEECTWPTYDPALTVLDEITIAIQVNGKLRGTIVVPTQTQQEEIQKLAQCNVSKWFEGQTIAKVIYVPGKLINFIVK